MPPPDDWTVEEADAALGWVGEVLELVRSAAEAAGVRQGNGHGAAGEDPGGVAEGIQELTNAGVVLRDPARGLVDFPARAPNGRAYLLCWVLGEESVGWWHWPQDGFAGRRPLSDPPS